MRRGTTSVFVLRIIQPSVFTQVFLIIKEAVNKLFLKSKIPLKNTFIDKIINNLRYADDTTLMAESEEERKSLLMKVKEEHEEVSLKLNIRKTKIMASVPITSSQTDGETMETVRDFIFLGSKITADDDFSHEIKKHLVLGRKAMINLDSIIKTDITLPTKVCLVKAVVSPVVMEVRVGP